MAPKQPCFTQAFSSLSSSSSSSPPSPALQLHSRVSVVQTTMAITQPTAPTEPIFNASYLLSRPTNASSKASSTYPTAKAPTESTLSHSAEETLPQSSAAVASATLFWSFQKTVPIKRKPLFGTPIACSVIQIDGLLGLCEMFQSFGCGIFKMRWTRKGSVRWCRGCWLRLQRRLLWEIPTSNLLLGMSAL